MRIWGKKFNFLVDIVVTLGWLKLFFIIFEKKNWEISVYVGGVLGMLGVECDFWCREDLFLNFGFVCY